jgi:hypothetical protein
VFIREKVVKGYCYFQVVRAVRDGAKVRQVIVAALGRNPTVEGALQAEKRSLARLRRDRGLWPARLDPSVYPKSITKRMASLDARIAESTERIERLKGIIKIMRAGAKNRARRANEKTGEG